VTKRYNIYSDYTNKPAEWSTVRVHQHTSTKKKDTVTKR